MPPHKGVPERIARFFAKIKRPRRITDKTPPSEGGNAGSTPAEDTMKPSCRISNTKSPRTESSPQTASESETWKLFSNPDFFQDLTFRNRYTGHRLPKASPQ